MSIIGVAMLESSGSPPSVSCLTLDKMSIESSVIFYIIGDWSFSLLLLVKLHATKPFQVGDLLNFLSAVFFGVHMLRTEHISRNTKRENFLPLLGYEVSIYCHYVHVCWIWNEFYLLIFIGGLLRF